MEEGLDLRQFNRQVVEHLRGLLLIKTGAAQADSALLDVTDETKKRLQAQAEGVSIPALLHWIKTFGDADANLRSTVYGQLPLEMAFIAATLPAEQPAAQPPARDHRAELESAAESIGVTPSQRPAPQRRPEPQPTRSAPPPPIHSELGSFALNGNGAKDQPQPVHEREPEPAPAKAEAQEDVEPETPAQDAEPQADDLEKLRTQWPNFVEQIKARSRAMASVYANTAMVRPVEVKNGVAVIAFRDPIHAKRSSVNEPGKPYRDVIETALYRVLGYKCRVECITFAQAEAGNRADDAPPASGNGAKKPKSKGPEPHETSRGKAAMNIFDIEKFEDTQ